MKINTKQKIYLSSGIFLIIVILLIYGIVKPLYLETQKTAALVESRNEKLIVLKKIDQEYLKKLESDHTIIEQDIALIKSGFLNDDKVVDFFIDLENIALNTSNRLEIETQEFPNFTIRLLGSFSNSMKFLGWLENSNYFFKTKFISMEGFSNKPLFFEEEFVESNNINTVLKIRNYIKNGENNEQESLENN